MRKYAAWLLAAVLIGVAGREASAQRRLTGRVVAAGGEPLASASVNVQGTTIGTYTSEDGRFTLTVPDGPQAIVARRIGYKRAVVPISATASDVTITLERDVLQLERQIVTGTATTVAAANAANAVATVSGSQLTAAPVPTLEQGLQGKVPGALITRNSGAPGGGIQVQLRGVTSIYGSSSPLYVVDGVLVNNSSIGTGLNSVTNAGGGISSSQDQPANRIADINPDDIESIEVLKGAAAGAIYGSKASNGVIVITTKRGSAGRPRYQFTQRLGTYQISRTLGLRCFSSTADATAWYQSALGDTTAQLPTPFTGECHQFEKEFYKPSGPSYESDLQVSGGAGNTTYFLDGRAKRDNAIQPNSYFQNQAITANIGQLLGSRVRVQSNNQFIHSLTDRGVSGNDNSPVVSPGDIFSQTPTFYNLKQTVNGLYLPNPYTLDGSQTNPFQTAALLKNPEDVYRYIGSINGTVSAYSSNRQTLDFNVIGGIDAYGYSSKLFSPPQLFFEPADGQPGTIVTNKTNSTYANFALSGTHKYLAAPFTATTSFGMRRERRQNDVILNQGRNIPPGVVNVDFAVNQATDETQFLVNDMSFYAQEEFLALGERLLLTAAVNAERSSVNGNPDAYYTYPKFNASYRLPFLPPYTNELKLRVAYGKAGNQPPYGFAFTTLPTANYSGQLAAYTSTIAGNPTIRPETSEQIEGGFDASFFDGRAGLEFTLYRTNVSDMILQAQVAPSTGFTTQYLNSGKMHNTGTEISFSMVPVQSKLFSWSSTTTYFKNSSHVDSLGVPCYNGGSYFSVRYGAPWVCTGYSLTAVQVQNGFDTTMVNGKAVRTNHYDVYESAPSFVMGFNNDVTVGPVQLHGLVDWRYGGKVVNLTNAYFDPLLTRADTLASMRRNELFSTAGGRHPVYLEDGGFVKLRELTASYLIPRSITSHLFPSGTQDIRLEVSGRDLYTWTKYTGYDPEVSNFSNQNIGRFQDVTPYPPSRSYWVSLRATF